MSQNNEFKKVTGTIDIENATIGFRNFSGKAGKYNAEGNRNFCVFLDRELALQLVKDGWNVRGLEPRDEDDGNERQPYLQVRVAFEPIPAVIKLTARGKIVSTVTEETVSMLDFAELENIDIIIRPYNYDFNGKQGVKAYLKVMYAGVVEDRFEHKYADNSDDVPDSAINCVGPHCPVQ